MRKKCLAMLLAVVMAVSLLPGTALAVSTTQSGQCGSNAYWTQDNEGTLTISGTGPMTNYDVILNWSPWHMGSAKAIKISDGITTIGSAAFGWMFSLKTVEIPRSVVSIGSDAFNNSRMITDIYYAGTEAEWNNIKIYSGNYTLNNATVHFGDGVSNDRSGACGPQLNWTLSADGTLTISGTGSMDDFKGGGDGTAPWYADRNNIKAVIIEEGVTTTGYCAFWECTNITTVDLPNTLTAIGDFSFALCTSLEKISIPSSVVQIGFSAFGACYALTNITIPDSIAVIEGQTFAECTGLKEITIPSGVTSIGDTAFWKCPNLEDVYYGGSKSDWENIRIGSDNENLFNATIHCKDSSEQKYRVYHNGGYEVFDVSMEQCMRIDDPKSSTTYNPQLAHMLMAMCNSVNNGNEMTDTFDSFGFGSKYRSEGIYLTYSMAKKQSGNESLVLIVVRGTKTFWENASNFDFRTDENGLHRGFADSANDLYRMMESFLGPDADFGNTHFVITGFSRGAAVANILAARLVDENVSQENIYAYAFACPDTVKSVDDKQTGYKCIYNVGNVNDLVSWVPEAVWGTSDNWKKFGQSHWFSTDWNDYENLEMVLDFNNIHNEEKYLEYLRNESTTSGFKQRSEARNALDTAAEWRVRQAIQSLPNISGRRIPYMRAHCPVDLEIYSASGVLVGSVIDNTVNNFSGESLYIYVDGNQKDVFFLDNGEYTVRFTGTDDGSMTYSVQNVDVDTWKFFDEIVFEKVALTTSKKMVSYISVEDEAVTSDLQLFVLNDTGEPEKEILPDGRGTEVPLGTHWVNPFTDVSESDWFYEYVAYVEQNGLMRGVGNRQFNPGGTTTRGTIMTILARQFGIDTTNSSPWYQMGMEWAVREGVSDGTNPGADITREQLATMLWRFAGESVVIGDLTSYSDVDDIHEWASSAMIWAVQTGIIQGSGGKLNPRGNASRAEAAAMLMRFCEFIKK